MSTPTPPGGDQLGAMPPAPGANGEPPVRPKAVDLACLLSLVGAVFAVVVVSVTLLGDATALRELTRQALENGGEAATDGDIANAMSQVRVVFGLGLAIFLAIVVFFVAKMRAGRNWARVVVVGVAAMNVMTFLTNAGAIGLGVDFAVNAVSVAIAVATIVYLFRRESNAYFLAVRMRRFGGPPRP